MERFDHATALALIDESLFFEVTTPALLQRARIHLWRGRYPEAERDADTALERGDDLRALEVAGAIAYYRRRFGRAHSLAIALLERGDQAALRLGGLVIGARAAHAAGDLGGALRLYRRALPLARRNALPEPASIYAFLEVHRGDTDHALELLQDPSRVRRGTASTAYTTAHDHFIGGYALATCGRLSEALDQWQQGSVEAERQGLVRYQALCLNLSSWVYRGIGELNRAREANDEARQAGRTVDYRELEAYAVLDLCETAMLDEDPDAAATWFDQARAITIEDYAYRWRHLLRLGIIEARTHLDRGDAERSLATATATAARARNHGARRYELLAHLVEVEATIGWAPPPTLSVSASSVANCRAWPDRNPGRCSHMPVSSRASAGALNWPRSRRTLLRPRSRRRSVNPSDATPGHALTRPGWWNRQAEDHGPRPQRRLPAHARKRSPSVTRSCHHPSSSGSPTLLHASCRAAPTRVSAS